MTLDSASGSMAKYIESLPPLPPHLSVPEHIAIIMDGNGRWAQERGLTVPEGHQEGAETLRKLLYACKNWGISTLTVYAFSTENWRRSQDEVDALMTLMAHHLHHSLNDLLQNKARLIVLGDISRLASDLQHKIRDVEKKTSEQHQFTLNVAFNYGARSEICRAVRSIAEKVKMGQISTTDDIDDTTVADHLYTHGQKDPDLFIRPGGEYRISNFLLWQLAYTELYFTPHLWPDFDHELLLQAIEAFSQRQRRFGSRPEAPTSEYTSSHHSQ